MRSGSNRSVWSPRRRPIRSSATIATATRSSNGTWTRSSRPPGRRCSRRATRSVTRRSASASAAWGIQWHLEIDRPELESWLDIFGLEGDLLTEWGKSAEEVRAEADRFMAAHEQRGRELFTRFTNVAKANAG